MTIITEISEDYDITIDSSDVTIIETGGEVSVIEPIEVSSVVTILEDSSDTIQVSDLVFVEAPMLTKRIDFVSDSEFYRGEALPGTSENNPAWRISFVVIAGDGDVSEKWADGNSNFDKVWVDRAILTYT